MVYPVITAFSHPKSRPAGVGGAPPLTGTENAKNLFQIPTEKTIWGMVNN